MRVTKQFHVLTLLISTGFITSCMVGPDFVQPKSPHTERYTSTRDPQQTARIKGAGAAGAAQQFAYNQQLKQAWWELFRSPVINDLVQLGLRNNPSITAAKAALVQAQENLNAQIGSTLLPAVNVGLSGTRQKPTNQPLNVFDLGVYNLFNASVKVSYTFDFFGSARRQIEALRAQVDYQSYELSAAYLTLTSNIVTTAINAASLQAQIDATEGLVKDLQHQLKIVNTQFELGGTPKSTVLSQEAQLAQVQATVPPLKQNLAVNLHLLATLIGLPPSDSQFSRFDLKQLKLPVQLPVSLPSTLVQQRPDVKAAEATLHVALAQVGVATANLFPQVTLTGSYGWTNTVPSALFDPHSKVWNVVTALTQPVFQGGALRAQRRAAIAALDVAAAQYKQTVLQAFKQVADSLRALEHDAQTLKAQQQAELAAKRSFELVKQQFSLGGVSYLSLLTAEQQYQQAKIGQIQAMAARYADTVALFQAMGGLWWKELLRCQPGQCEGQSS